jgi:Ca-activated chloride channel homolog
VIDLLSPYALALLGLLPVLIVARIWALRRRRSGVRYSSLSLVREALPRSSRIRRHLPFAVFVLALASLMIAIARPAGIVSVPTGRTTVILALDVSRSMCATDIAPSRIQAAEAAASSFVERQGPNTQIGIVAFAGFAEIVQAPTTDREVLLDVIASLTTGRRTAVGSAILESIDAIAEVDPSVPRSAPDAASPDAGPSPVPNGAYASAIVVLLTDGSNNAGPPPTDAAAQAAARGLRVYTIGFGTDDPGAESAACGQPFIGREPGAVGGGFGGGAGGLSRGIDDETLKAIAATTGGTYYPASSADQLNAVFASLPTNLITRHEVVELSVVFVAIGAVLMAVAILLGQAWRPLP